MAAATALVVLSSSPVGSATVLRLTDEELTERADVVLHGKCTGKTSRLPQDGSDLIYTEYTFDVLGRLKGDEGGGKTFTFRALGGVVGNRGLVISGAPVYTQGEEVIAFLDRPHEKTGCRHTIGLAQGKFRVVADESGAKLLERDLDGLRVLDPRTGDAMEPPKEPRRKLEPFVQLVRDTLKRKR
jgi:hypothetical protein